jgi:hypothetical protein
MALHSKLSNRHIPTILSGLRPLVMMAGCNLNLAT